MKKILVWFLLLLASFLPQKADAYTVLPGYGQGSGVGLLQFAVNQDSFVTNLNGLSLTRGEALFWSAWAAEQWHWRTGAGVIFSAYGDTDYGNSESDCYTAGLSFVAVVPGCVHGDNGSDDCNALGYSRISSSWPYSDEGKNMCIYGGTGNQSGAVNWEIDLDGFSTSFAEVDLISVMVHEFGHWALLGHSPGSVMDAAGAPDWQIHRDPTDDDSQGIRYTHSDQVGINLKMYPLDSAGINGSPVNAMSNTTWARHNGVSLAIDGTTYIVRGVPSPASNDVHFARTPAPVTSTSTWVNRSVHLAAGEEGKYGTWATPGMATNGSGTIVAAWPAKESSTTGCSEIVTAKSTDMFDTATFTELSNSPDCLIPNDAIAVAYDGVTARWVLAFRYGDAWANEPGIVGYGNMGFKTSTDGVNWGATYFVAVSSVHPVSLAFKAGSSVGAVVYTHRQLGQVYTRSLTVSSTGTLTLGTGWNAYTVRQIQPPSVGARFDSVSPFLVCQSGESRWENYWSLGDTAPFSLATSRTQMSIGDAVSSVPTFLGRQGSVVDYILRTE
jgi:hypothetical protein